MLKICSEHFHVHCLAERCLRGKAEFDKHIFPIDGNCPKCEVNFFWVCLLKFWILNISNSLINNDMRAWKIEVEMLVLAKNKATLSFCFSIDNICFRAKNYAPNTTYEHWFDSISEIIGAVKRMEFRNICIRTIQTNEK